MTAVRVVGILASILVAGAAVFVLLLSITFGSGGFGGSSPNEHETLAQALLLIAALGAAGSFFLPGWWSLALVVAQVGLLVTGVHLTN